MILFPWPPSLLPSPSPCAYIGEPERGGEEGGGEESSGERAQEGREAAAEGGEETILP